LRQSSKPFLVVLAFILCYICFHFTFVVMWLLCAPIIQDGNRWCDRLHRFVGKKVIATQKRCSGL
jgi:hypothetical protein